MFKTIKERKPFSPGFLTLSRRDAQANVSKRLKGQYLVIEDVLLFSVGFALIVGIAGTFFILNNSIQDASKEIQYRELANIIAANEQAFKLGNVTGSISMPVSMEIAGSPYAIEAYLNGAKYMLVVGLRSEHPAQLMLPLPVMGTTEGFDKILLEHNGTATRLRGTSS